MALEPRVVSEHLAWGEQRGGPAQRIGRAGQEQRSERNPLPAQMLFELAVQAPRRTRGQLDQRSRRRNRELKPRAADHVVPPVFDQFVDLVHHSLRQRRVTAAETDHDCLGILTEHAAVERFQLLPHGTLAPAI
jgi:hypothetical protein